MLADANEFVEMLKRAAIRAVEAQKPVEFCFGEVKSISPLKILVEQKIPLGESQLILCRNVTEHKIHISVENVQDFFYEGESQSSMKLDPTRFRAIKRMPVTVHHGLVVGDNVILFRQQGGQKYIVVDRIG